MKLLTSGGDVSACAERAGALTDDDKAVWAFCRLMKGAVACEVLGSHEGPARHASIHRPGFNGRRVAVGTDGSQGRS